MYRNIGDPATWGAVRAADLRIGVPLRRAAAVSALYPAAREHLVAAYRLDPGRVVTIPNGVPEHSAADSADRARARAALHLADELDWIGFVGALSEEKGILSAVTAAGLDAGVGLVVAGDGPERAAAERLADDLAPGRVRFLGVVEQPWTLLAAVDAVVLPSRTEGIPATAIEAGLTGRPVVATNVGGMAEVVDDDVTGVLVDDASPPALAAALRRALEHRQRMGAAARQRCLERYTMDQVARQWAELISAVAQRRSPASSR